MPKRINTKMINETKNMIKAIEEFQLESKDSEISLNGSWIKKPAIRLKQRILIEEFLPDWQVILNNIMNENKAFQSNQESPEKYIPETFD